ncbi:glycoside hydrolase family 5 protein [Aciditerrimonas ferrireducens]|uniref:Glycoside hydrolase family 5 protein n=1 Tax=Aciditerrimonas ferrireducens TaxID=667306 RepID=A0ABV6C0K3_9ACTN
MGLVLPGCEALAVPRAGGQRTPQDVAAVSAVPWVQVSGNQLVNDAGKPIRLLGVDRSGTEYACAEGWGIFDGPADQASVNAIAAWGANAVRIPLNEDCWLGINGVNPAFSGAPYRQAIEAYVQELAQDHLEAILDLHWSAPGGIKAMGQAPMPDEDHSPAFWASVADTFKDQPNVLFDLFNEPEGVGWSCWLDGCTVPAQGALPAYRAAGMQQLVDVVRQAGATQPIVLGGIDWAGNLSGWLAAEPSDPLHQLVADIHVYDFSACASTTCWDDEILPVAERVPVVADEVGQAVAGSPSACPSTSFAQGFFAWAAAHDVSWLAWAWDTWGCPYGLVANAAGSPTPWGSAVRSALLGAPQPALGTSS